jgi:hypothetical protein
MDRGNEATDVRHGHPAPDVSILKDDREHVGNPRVPRLGVTNDKDIRWSNVLAKLIPISPTIPTTEQHTPCNSSP